MAGDEEKKKKKKSKKGADAAPAEEVAPPPEPEPPAPAAAEEVAAEEVAVEGEQVEAAPLEGEEGELPPQPKKKPKFFVHWDRRKAKFYDYNFDYGTNYYQSMVTYVDNKNIGPTEVPRRMAFAERGMYSSLERSRTPDIRTQNLLNDVRNSIRNFEISQRIYAYGVRH